MSPTFNLTQSANIRQRAGKPGEDPLNYLLSNKLLSALPAEDFARLLPHLAPVSLSSGETLYRVEEPMSFVYFPETAVISHLHLLEDGGTTEAALIGREGITGLSAIFNYPPPDYLTEVVIAGNALRIRAEIIRQEFAQGGAMQQLLLNYAGARMAQLSHRAVCNGNHKVEERLCTWLLMVHDRTGGEPLALTHEQIARHLGTRRAGVTSAANLLRDRNIISYSRGQIRILSREAIEVSACECYSVVRQKFDALL